MQCGKRDDGGDITEARKPGRRGSLGAEEKGTRGTNLFENLQCIAALWVRLRQSQPSLLGGFLETDKEGKLRGPSRLYHLCI